MNNILNKFVIGVSICLLATSCAKKLDVLPPSEVVSENFWKTQKDAWIGLNACYSQLPGWDGYIELASDNGHSQKPWEGPYELIQQNAVSVEDDLGAWAGQYENIRIQNNFIEKVDGCEMDEVLKTRMKAEARFIRAFGYLYLVSYYGKVPLITSVMPYNNEPVPRDDLAKVQKFILDELDEVADILPQSYDGTFLNEKGRITRSGALALRARAALYFGNYAEAEKSADLVISEGQHHLFRVSVLNAAQQKEADEMDQFVDFQSLGIDKDKFMKGVFSYEALWHTENANPDNPEYIVDRGYMADPSQNDWTRYTYIRPSQLISGYSSFTPMQDLVDAYWEVDGKTIPTKIPTQIRTDRITAINKEVAGLDQEAFIAKMPTMDLKDDAYMKEFRNRDSRLYASILFAFKGWHETDFGTFYYQWNTDKYNDGNESLTGYSWRKMVALNPYPKEFSGEAYSADDFPIIRYAEVLLTYAEAHIETTGWDSKVTVVLNDMRDRCGMPDVPATMTGKTTALDFVRNERRIELAGEGNRYFDMRRYGNEYCAKVMKGETYAPSGDPVVKKEWNQRLLLLPIPQSAIDLNPLLKGDQNAGY
ncbi:MAG TPA: RagB/SusD family nutrient uptake outer membrane protein [Arachidicoccus sp.]|nr:RagB/SusD family nutrient uptake outer membrane protein [Arachidicoccus sp.]